MHEHNLYSVPLLSTDLGIQDKIALLREADQAARGFDARIHQVQTSYIDETKHVLIVTSNGRYTWDLQPLVRLNVSCIAEENGKRQSGYQGAGGRRSLDIFRDELNPTALAREAARLAILRVVEARRRNPPLSSFTAAEALRRAIEPFFLRRGGHGQRRQ